MDRGMWCTFDNQGVIVKKLFRKKEILKRIDVRV